VTDQERRSTVDRWVTEFAGRVLRIARSFAPDQDASEDLSQEVWLAVYRKAHLCPDLTCAGSWIHSLAVRVCIDRKRKTTRREALYKRWFRRGEEDAAADGGTDSLAEARLWSAIDALPPRQRDVVLCRYIDDKSTAETALTFGIAEGSVKASLFKALRTLRSQLDSPEMRELIHGRPRDPS
jgi:RNA polymerase sigma factor (sigma-70 family)